MQLAKQWGIPVFAICPNIIRFGVNNQKANTTDIILKFKTSEIKNGNQSLRAYAKKFLQ